VIYWWAVIALGTVGVLKGLGPELRDGWLTWRRKRRLRRALAEMQREVTRERWAALEQVDDDSEAHGV
jgi:hypothetical protein